MADSAAPFQTVWETDAQGSNYYQSPAWYRYIGEPEGSSYGDDWLRYYHPDDREFLQSEWSKTLQTGGTHPYDIVVRIRRHDGHYRWFRIQGTAVKASDGSMLKWVGTCTDVHDQWSARGHGKAGHGNREQRAGTHGGALWKAFDIRFGVLQRRLFLTVLAGLIPVALLLSVMLVQNARNQKQAILEGARDTTQALMSAVDGELGRIVGSMDALAANPRLHANDFGAFHADAREFISRHPEILNVIVSTATGQQVMNARVPIGEPLPARIDTESLERAVDTGRPAIGNMVHAPVLDSMVFGVRVPILSQGRAAHVLSAIVTPRAKLELIERQRIHEQGIAAILDAHGQFVARSQHHDKLLGQRASAELMKTLGKQSAGEFRRARTVEGFAVYPVGDTSSTTGWSVVLGIPAEVVDAPVVRSYVVSAASLVLSVLLGLMAAFFIARRITRPMEQLERAAVDVREGRPPTILRTDLTEVRAAANALAAAHAEREKLVQSEREARLLAETANKSKDEFLAMLGHEIRNPLAAISTAAQLLRRTEDAALLKRAEDVIARQALHLGKLTDDLLDAGRVVLGKISLVRQPVDLGTLVKEHLATLSNTARLSDHVLKEDIGPAWVNGDSTRLDQVIGNLVGNALKYTPPGGTIAVAVFEETGEAILRIRDSGIGLEPELLPRVFDLFVQGRTSIERSEGGLGVGLTMVRRLVELHGGSVEAKSTGPDRGSEFTVRLPAISPPVAAASRTTAENKKVRRVVIVEDNADVRTSLRQLIELDGHTVYEAADGPSGVDAILREQPDVAFVDIGLPILDGHGVASAVRRRSSRHIPLIALTGYGSRSDDPSRSLFDQYVIKPLNPEMVHDLVCSAGR